MASIYHLPGPLLERILLSAALDRLESTNAAPAQTMLVRLETVCTMFKEALGSVLLWHFSNDRDEMLFHKHAIRSQRARPLEVIRLTIEFDEVDIGLVCQTALLLAIKTLTRFELIICTEGWEARQPDCWELLFFTLARCKCLEELVLDARAGYWGVNYFNIAILDFSPTDIIGVFGKLDRLSLFGCSFPPATLKGLLKAMPYLHDAVVDGVGANEALKYEIESESLQTLEIREDSELRALRTFHIKCKSLQRLQVLGPDDDFRVVLTCPSLTELELTNIGFDLYVSVEAPLPHLKKLTVTGRGGKLNVESIFAAVSHLDYLEVRKAFPTVSALLEFSFLKQVKHLVLHDWMEEDEAIFGEDSNKLQGSIEIVGWMAIHATGCLVEKEILEARQTDHGVIREVLKRARPKHFFAHNIDVEVDRKFLRALEDEFPQMLVTVRKW